MRISVGLSSDRSTEIVNKKGSMWGPFLLDYLE
jgi:hypothetical protein